MAKQHLIRMVVVAPDKVHSYVKTIKNELSELQAIAGGSSSWFVITTSISSAMKMESWTG
jgi:hypothetical protein